MTAKLYHNKMKGAAPIAQRSGHPLKYIQNRLNSKTGRIRDNLGGKRVDHSACSVIGVHANLSIR